MMKQTSLEARDWIRKREGYSYGHQKIINVLSDGTPRTREQINTETNMKIQTVTARCTELKKLNIVQVVGRGKTSSGCSAELLKING